MARAKLSVKSEEEERLTQEVFGDLANFGALRLAPGKALFPALQGWSKNRLADTLTEVPRALQDPAMENFNCVLGWMRDWDACYQHETLAGEVMVCAMVD